MSKLYPSNMIPVATRPFCSVRQCLIQPSLPDLHQEVIPKTYRNSVGQLGKEPSGVSDVLRKSIRVRMTSVRIISVYQFTYRVGTVLASQKIPTFGPRRDAIYTMSLPNQLAHSLYSYPLRLHTGRELLRNSSHWPVVWSLHNAGCVPYFRLLV